MVIWRPVRDYEDLYEVSNDGRVRNIQTKRELSMHDNGYGYMTVLFSRKGRYFHKKIHRLVAEAFIPNSCGHRYVNHIDENKSNNKVNNLEWCTASHNVNHGTRNRRVAQKLAKPVVQFDGKIFVVWDSIIEASRKTGVNNSHISSCCKGERKTAGGYKWRYFRDEEEMA